jgi:hypothetical protein
MLIMGYKKKCEEMGILDDVMNRINELNIWIFRAIWVEKVGKGKLPNLEKSIDWMKIVFNAHALLTQLN